MAGELRSGLIGQEAPKFGYVIAMAQIQFS